MICENCGKKNARVRKVSRTYGKGDDIVIIENIPAISCPDCGESYMTAETLHEIERLKTLKKSLGVERCVEVVNFV
jgi:YgiT-type zinc finger domain-containing protein